MQQRNKSKSPRTRQKTKKDRENDQHFCTTEMQIIVCSLLVSYVLVFFVFKLADKDFSILYTVKQSHVNIDITSCQKLRYKLKQFIVGQTLSMMIL